MGERLLRETGIEPARLCSNRTSSMLKYSALYKDSGRHGNYTKLTGHRCINQLYFLFLWPIHRVRRIRSKIKMDASLLLLSYSAFNKLVLKYILFLFFSAFRFTAFFLYVLCFPDTKICILDLRYPYVPWRGIFLAVVTKWSKCISWLTQPVKELPKRFMLDLYFTFTATKAVVQVYLCFFFFGRVEGGAQFVKNKMSISAN